MQKNCVRSIFEAPKIDYLVLINTLGVNIANGNIRLQCLKNEVPKIQGNISAVVTQVDAALKVQTNLVTQLSCQGSSRRSHGQAERTEPRY